MFRTLVSLFTNPRAIKILIAVTVLAGSFAGGYYVSHIQCENEQQEQKIERLQQLQLQLKQQHQRFVTAQESVADLSNELNKSKEKQRNLYEKLQNQVDEYRHTSSGANCRVDTDWLRIYNESVGTTDAP